MAASAAVPRLMLVTDRTLVPPGALPGVTAEAVAGGVDCVQVREKDLDDAALRELVRAVQAAVMRVSPSAPIVVNGRPAVARSLGVGLHLPEADTLPEPLAEGWPLWGRSVHTTAGAAAAVAEGPDYLVAGPLFATGSHPGAPPLGEDGLRRIAGAAGTVPVLAIGGITPDGVAAAVAAGAAGVAVRSDVLSAPSPRAAAAALRRALSQAGVPDAS
jgi:thiamine-phosphate diphosphorylase